MKSKINYICKITKQECQNCRENCQYRAEQPPKQTETALTDDYIAKLNELENRWQNEDEDGARILHDVMTGKVKDDEN